MKSDKSKKWQYAVVLIIVLGLSPYLSAETLKMGGGDWCPYVCDPKNENGKEGYLADILRSVFEKEGYTLTIENQAFTRNLKETEAGRQHGTIGMYRADAPDFVFPQTSLGVSVIMFVTKKGFSWKYSGVESLKKIRLGVIKGYDYADKDFTEYIASQPPETVTVMTGTAPLERLLKMITMDRIQAVVDDRAVLQYCLLKNGLENELADAGLMGEESQVYIGFSPAIAESRKYARILSDGVESLRKTGELNKIMSKYGMQDWQAK